MSEGIVEVVGPAGRIAVERKDLARYLRQGYSLANDPLADTSEWEPAPEPEGDEE